MLDNLIFYFFFHWNLDNEIFSNHFIWNHSVFQHETYVFFSQKIEVCQNVKMMFNQLSIFYQMMSQLADQLQFLNARNEQRLKELQMLINHSLEQHDTQSQQQLQQLFAFSSLTFWLEQLSAQLDMTVNQYVSTWVSIAVILLAHSSCSSSSLQSSNRLELESESSKYQMCHTVKTVKTLWHEWTVDLWDRSFIDRLDQQWDSQWRTDCHSKLQFYSL